jgi:hypothetical protein
VELDGGRLQALDIAWDIVGNRWFSLYPNQPAFAGEGFHWTGPYKNWPARGAVCHQTNFQKNYDPRTQTYESAWSEVNAMAQAKFMFNYSAIPYR